MAANSAGAVQEAHHGAVWWRKPGLRAASHPCCPRLPLGIPLQTITSLPCKVLIVLFLISRRQCSVRPAHDVLDIKTASAWLQIKAAPCFELKSCRMFHKRHQQHRQVWAVSSQTGSMHDISTYITSRDSAPTSTRMERLLALRTHEKLENAALRENYKHGGAITDMKELVRSVVARLWPPEAQKHFKVDCGWTLRGVWTFRNMEACGRVRLKASQALVPVGFIFVADLNTLMLLNVYIRHECLPALMAQIPLDVCAEPESCHGSQHESKPEETL